MHDECIIEESLILTELIKKINRTLKRAQSMKIYLGQKMFLRRFSP